MRRLIAIAAIAAIALVALTGCSRAEIDAWLGWHATDPAAALEFANRPDVQADLHPPAALTNNHAARWRSIGWCESGSQVHHPPVHNRHGSFSGLYMIKSDVWDHYGGGEFASDAWQASEAEQTEIAERILADVGWRAWQCA
jgi:hypothetical protein